MEDEAIGMLNQTGKPTVENSVDNADNAEPINYESLYRQAADSIKELTAERDSLLTENTELRAARDAAIEDGAKAREMNYTLSRQLNIAGTKQRSAEQIMGEMFLKKKGD